jgi:hypothetical protein
MDTFVLRSVTALVLVSMGYQDFKYRGISWYSFPLLCLLLICINPHFNSSSMLWNLGFIVLVFSLLTLWFSIRTGAPVNFLDSYIGLGDVLFLVCLSVYFSPMNFFLFYLTSLLLIAVATLFYQLSNKKDHFTVPLAGLQGIGLLLLLLFSWVKGIEISEVDLVSHLL